ncbi:MAG: hypothetical protein AAF489_00200 [Bacteroidota bacterium]
MEDSTTDNLEGNFPEYSILGPELTTFVLQVGFVEGIEMDSQAFSNLTDACQHIFRNNKEYAIILWNGIPIRLSYVEDIPFMVEGLIAFLRRIQNNSKKAQYELATANLQWQWIATQENDVLTITSNFVHLKGNYENALEPLSLLKAEVGAFISEWKLLLQQLVTAIEHSDCKLSSKKSRQALKHLQILNEGVINRGRLYA